MQSLCQTAKGINVEEKTISKRTRSKKEDPEKGASVSGDAEIHTETKKKRKTNIQSIQTKEAKEPQECKENENVQDADIVQETEEVKEHPEQEDRQISQEKKEERPEVEGILEIQEEKSMDRSVHIVSFN